MEMSSSTLFGLFVAVATISLVSSLPTRPEDVLQETSGMALDKRPKYMDTRRDLDIFKDLVMMSIQELVDEERLSPSVLSEDEAGKGVDKRAYMGICVRKQHNQIRHFPCLRSGR
ncbi:whitnin [Plakobranchus ocellatus]|uniref:Whitnin n=1 Tax=Plakobranchus ocellatus TaxID=259542 RepID=A0AAV4E1R1_9GAST|nr:whitnin [Plakobranchus ocellatus]